VLVEYVDVALKLQVFLETHLCTLSYASPPVSVSLLAYLLFDPTHVPYCGFLVYFSG